MERNLRQKNLTALQMCDISLKELKKNHLKIPKKSVSPERTREPVIYTNIACIRITESCVGFKFYF